MRALALWLVPAAVLAGQARFARLGELDGKAEVQLHAADPWQPAVRNLPLVESSWVRTSASSRVEMELDDASVLRLTGDSLAELSDYTRLSTGQRVTLLSLDQGVAYFTGQPDAKDALILAVPGAQITIRRGVRVRLEAREDASQIAVLEGAVRFSSPAAELELKEGQMARVEAARSARFFLYREITPLDSDRWSLERDKLAASVSARRLPGMHCGFEDLDAHGTWIETKEYGPVWKPQAPANWVPFRDGRWMWYDELGYTWIANESWGWLPFHFGRWIEHSGSGWIWLPGASTVFKPGEVYWLRAGDVVGWGPLAPDEVWDARSVPRQYLKANTTFAKWVPEARELAPAEAPEKPNDPLAAAVFVVAPPSPAFAAARLEATRPALRAGSTRIVPILPGVTFAPATQTVQETAPVEAAAPAPAAPLPAAETSFVPPVVSGVAQPVIAPPPVYVPVPVPEPVEVFYPAPVYTGIVVVNPPEQKHERPASPPPAAKPSAGTPAPPGALTGIPRGENREHRLPPPVSHPVEPSKPQVSAPHEPSKPPPDASPPEKGSTKREK